MRLNSQQEDRGDPDVDQRGEPDLLGMIRGLRIAASSTSAFDRLGTPGRRRASVDRRSCAVSADRGRRGSGEPPSRSRRVLAGRPSRQPTSGRGWPACQCHVDQPWSSELGQRGCTSISAGDGQPELARTTADRAGLPASATTARRRPRGRPPGRNRMPPPPPRSGRPGPRRPLRHRCGRERGAAGSQLGRATTAVAGEF